MGSEPTDAMVEAAQDAWIKTRLKSAGNHKVAMRAALAAALSAQEEQIERLREALTHARTTLNELWDGHLHNTEAGCEAWADVGGAGTIHLIDARLEGSKRDG